jgi:hypothetical protein
MSDWQIRENIGLSLALQQFCSVELHTPASKSQTQHNMIMYLMEEFQDLVSDRLVGIVQLLCYNNLKRT